MGKLNPKQVENLTEPGTYEDGDVGFAWSSNTQGASLGYCASAEARWSPPGNGFRGSYPEISLKSARLEARGAGVVLAR